jgi:hypothetical protein
MGDSGLGSDFLTARLLLGGGFTDRGDCLQFIPHLDLRFSVGDEWRDGGDDLTNGRHQSQQEVVKDFGAIAKLFSEVNKSTGGH